MVRGQKSVNPKSLEQSHPVELGTQAGPGRCNIRFGFFAVEKGATRLDIRPSRQVIIDNLPAVRKPVILSGIDVNAIPVWGVGATTADVLIAFFEAGRLPDRSLPKRMGRLRLRGDVRRKCDRQRDAATCFGRTLCSVQTECAVRCVPSLAIVGPAELTFKYSGEMSR